MNRTEFHAQLHWIFAQDAELNGLPLEDLLERIPRVDELEDVDQGSPVLVRTDLDVPLEGDRVADPSRLEASAATVRHGIERGWKMILFGHLGRDPQNSLAPVSAAFAELLDTDIRFIDDWIDEAGGRLTPGVADQISAAPAGSVFMLQNTRKYDLERALWKAKEDAFPGIADAMFQVASEIRQSLAAVEVNEAIAASNIDFSSAAIPLVMSRTAMGFFLAEEMRVHIRGARRATAVVFSGLKINKLDDIEGMVDRGGLDVIVAAGSLAMALLKARARRAGGDFGIGLAETDPSQKAYIDPSRVEQASRILATCEEAGTEVVLPVDFVLDDGTTSATIPADRCQMDVGPETTRHYAETLRAYAARTTGGALFYNGVFGKFEDPQFEAGTRDFIPLLKELTAAGLQTYVGGGEGRLALLKYGSLDDVTHAFTCGGTVLKSLTNRHIAYLKAMYLQNTQGQAEPG